MTTTQTPETTTPEQLATVTPIVPDSSSPTRGTWKQHGNPVAGWQFFGTHVKAADTQGANVAKVETNSQGITLKGGNGRAIKGGAFGAATKFWAIVPADATRQEPTPKPVKADSTPAAPIEISAPKGGDQFVTPIKGAIAKAITATGKSIQAIAREHGQNPSQLRRLVAGTVAKVDLPRAESIAKALGVKLSDLFGAPEVKAGKAVKTPAAPKGGTKPKGKGNRTSRATAKAAQDAAGRQAPEAVTTETPAAPEGTAATTETPAV